MPAPNASPMSLSGAIRAATQSGKPVPPELRKAQAMREMMPPGGGNALQGAGAGNALTAAVLQAAGASPAPAPGGAQASNPLTGAGLPANRLMAPASASPGPANALTAAAGGGAPAPPPMPPQAMPAPPVAPPPSPNPQLDQVAQAAAAANLSPADAARMKQRSEYVAHALMPLVRQDGPITPADLISVTRGAVKDGAISADEAGSFLGKLPTDQASLRQALGNQVQQALLTRIHLAAPVAAPAPPGSPQQAAPDGSN